MSELAISGEAQEPARLPKHRYPIAVTAATALALAAAGYSFTRAPGLVDAGRRMHSGQAEIRRQDYLAAAAQLQRAHKEVPSSRKITISLAEADFGANLDRAGLKLLQGMSLSQSEWSTLTKTMPASIQALFQPTK